MTLSRYQWHEKWPGDAGAPADGYVTGEFMASSSVAQGVREALRNAYSNPRDSLPAEFCVLLDRLDQD